jgi:hypothetical protein
MIDGNGKRDEKYLSTNETLSDDNYIPETKAKIQHSLSFTKAKNKIAPLATK